MAESFRFQRKEGESDEEKRRESEGVREGSVLNGRSGKMMLFWRQVRVHVDEDGVLVTLDEGQIGG